MRLIPAYREAGRAGGVDLGGADDRLASAALGAPVDLAHMLDGVPLVATGAAFAEPSRSGSQVLDELLHRRTVRAALV